MDAANTHLQAVTAAQPEAEILVNGLLSIPTVVDIASAKVGSALAELSEFMQKVAAHADTVAAHAAATVATGEEHRDAAEAAGHKTAPLARAAFESCEGANGAVLMLKDQIGDIVAALEGMKDSMVGTVLATGAQGEEVGEGARVMKGHLNDAERHINEAIGS